MEINSEEITPKLRYKIITINNAHKKKSFNFPMSIINGLFPVRLKKLYVALLIGYLLKFLVSDC